MFGKKKRELRIVELSPEERKMAITALMQFRNKLVALNKPTKDVNDLLLRLL